MRVFTTILLTLIIRTVFSQSNGGFETNGADGCRNDAGAFTLAPFNDGKVSNWQASHGTPQINRAGCSSGENDVHSGSEAAFIFFDNTNKEGVFQNIVIKKDESFNVALFAKALDANSKVIIKFTSGLTNAPIGNGGNVQIPNPSSQQLVIEQTLTNSWQEVRIDEIIADADYSQVWIYAMDGTILVDDFSFFKSCCEPFKLWQDITNPPSTYVNNYIKAGENVDGTQPTGKVLITADADPIVFQAGQSIELGPGFDTELGAPFTAEIVDCGEREFEITLLEIAPWVISGSIDRTCNKRYQVSACFGSGDYQISWDNGYGEDRTFTEWNNRSEIQNDQSNNISLTSPQWLFVTVIDNVSNDTIRKGVHIPASPFSGAFNFDIFNVITPNGDGINDSWAVIDSTRLGSDSFGYNAFHYVLNLFERGAGQSIHCDASGEDATRGPNQPTNKVGTNRSKGFAYDEIDWVISDYCSWTDQPEAPYTLFGCLKLANCSQTTNFTFTITVFCTSSSAPFVLNIDSISNTPDFLVFPNPTSNLLNVSSEGNPPKGIQLFDSKGVIVRKMDAVSDSAVLLKLDGLSSGHYILRILTQDNKIITKAIIIK
jgi:hypothetical protein